MHVPSYLLCLFSSFILSFYNEMNPWQRERDRSGWEEMQCTHTRYEKHDFMKKKLFDMKIMLAFHLKFFSISPSLQNNFFQSTRNTFASTLFFTFMISRLNFSSASKNCTWENSPLFHPQSSFTVIGVKNFHGMKLHFGNKSTILNIYLNSTWKLFLL
jgi:hypothetical protein